MGYTRYLSLGVAFLLLAAGCDRAASGLTAEGNGASDEKAPANLPEKAKGPLLTLDAKPEPVTLDTAKTAVLVVDMQNDFGAKGGMFDRAGIDISGIM